MGRFLREMDLTRHPVQEFQHHIKGEINQNHATLACNKDRCRMQEKQYAATVFMDIQGAFDSTTFAVIQEALESCDVDSN